jgi:phosphopantetheinyl transferase (holo-ACP synthase)
MVQALPPEFSRAELLAELGDLRATLPDTPLRERMLGVPDFLRRGTADARVREWELSRSSLLEAYRALRAQEVNLAEKGKELRLSFSHSGGAAVAIAISAGRERGFGVDIEREGREITNAAFARFFRTEEGEFLKDRLSHWVLKEACFKAHPRSSQTIVADYVVTGGEAAEAAEFSVLCTRGAPERFRGALGTTDGYRYAFAVRTSF